ncbi:PREDICTED: sister chromatid [Prunus dulcis]|uniref:PREDICTED: sister chromatid n=1 Tax=Prunus dulcis TaxID=3755 RepID=A0A5E4ERX6_PRUDU|nr:PREDICTED: sister chromatid [Prunus dulcis]
MCCNVEPFEDFSSGVDSQSLEPSIDKQRRHSGMARGNSDPAQVVPEELIANPENDGLGGTDANPIATPGNSDDVRSGPELSIWAGNIPSEANSGRTGCEQIQQEKGLILHLDIAVLELNPYLR